MSFKAIKNFGEYINNKKLFTTKRNIVTVKEFIDRCDKDIWITIEDDNKDNLSKLPVLLLCGSAGSVQNDNYYKEYNSMKVKNITYSGIILSSKDHTVVVNSDNTISFKYSAAQIDVEHVRYHKIDDILFAPNFTLIVE